ncbi:unknown [Alistipes sp. CAG:53]|nr:unknown [Alistipes sp. CAG:53]
MALRPGAGADLARRLPRCRRRLQLAAEDRRLEERCGGRDGGAGPYGLLAAARDGRQFHGDRAPFRRRGTLDVQPPAAAGADRLRRRCGAGRGPAGRTGLRHRAVRRGVFAPRRALCRRLRLLEPLGRGTLCRLDAAVCRDHPFAQGGRRPPLFGGLYRQGRRADDRRTVERGRILARERRAELRGRAP